MYLYCSTVTGTNNSTTFVDETGRWVRPAGNAKISTTQSKFGGSSAYFDGSGDYLELNFDYGLNFGTGNLTIEGWIYPQGAGSPLFNGQASNNLLNLYLDSSTSGRLLLSGGNAITGITFTANTWQHVAIVRNGNTWTVYVNGVSAGTATNSNSFDCSSNSFIGGYFGGHYFTGYVDEVRITKGVARYTSGFSPPTAEFEYTPVNKTYALLNDRVAFAPMTYSGYITLKAYRDPTVFLPNYYDGGTRVVEGAVTYNGVPASRKVSLLTLREKRLVAEQWSDPVTGAYSFGRLKDQGYFVWSDDYLEVFDPITHIAVTQQG